MSGVGEPPTRAWHVVIVDDDAEIRRFMGRMLASTGEFVVVGEASDGASAIPVVRDLQPDVVLLDLSMPVMDGLEALPHIVDSCATARVVMSSGSPEPRVVREARERGVVGFLDKSGNVAETLLPRLREAVGAEDD
jgi:CheY-like chemotaxis protein